MIPWGEYMGDRASVEDGEYFALDDGPSKPLVVYLHRGRVDTQIGRSADRAAIQAADRWARPAGLE
jgi:hypothetical protein